MGDAFLSACADLRGCYSAGGASAQSSDEAAIVGAKRVRADSDDSDGPSSKKHRKDASSVGSDSDDSTDSDSSDDEGSEEEGAHADEAGGVLAADSRFQGFHSLAAGASA